MNNFNFEAMMEHGFLIIPKALLQQQIEDPNIEAGEIEALLKILMKVNYSDTLYSDRQHKDYLCKRGESMFSYRDWSRIFRWSVGKTFRFIHALAILADQVEGVLCARYSGRYLAFARAARTGCCRCRG